MSWKRLLVVTFLLFGLTGCAECEALEDAQKGVQPGQVPVPVQKDVEPTPIPTGPGHIPTGPPGQPAPAPAPPDPGPGNPGPGRGPAPTPQPDPGPTFRE
jgi:hypothetical protein